MISNSVMTCMNKRTHQGVAHIRVFKEPKILQNQALVMFYMYASDYLNIATTSIHGLLDGSRLVMLGNTDGDT